VCVCVCVIACVNRCIIWGNHGRCKERTKWIEEGAVHVLINAARFFCRHT
jgi:hypothetical protein